MGSPRSPSTPGCAWCERRLGRAGGQSPWCQPPVGASKNSMANGTLGYCALTAD